MHATLSAVRDSLTNIIAQVRSTIPNDEPFGTAHSNWSFPGLTRLELIEEAQSIIDLIEHKGIDDLGGQEARIQDYIRRLQHLQAQTVPQIWANAGLAVPAYMLTLTGLRKTLEPVLTRDLRAEASATERKLLTQLRGMEARLKGLEPRTVSLSTMVERIEDAHSAADQLPTDLVSLSEARQKIDALVQEATKDQGRLLIILEKAEELDKKLKQSAEDAKAVLERCETAYSAATS